MRQILVTNKNNPQVHRMTWIQDDEKLIVGNFVRFKDQQDFWEIKEVYDKEIDKCNINRSWHVGGL